MPITNHMTGYALTPTGGQRLATEGAARLADESHSITDRVSAATPYVRTMADFCTDKPTRAVGEATMMLTLGLARPETRAALLSACFQVAATAVGAGVGTALVQVANTALHDVRLQVPEDKSEVASSLAQAVVSRSTDEAQKERATRALEASRHSADLHGRIAILDDFFTSEAALPSPPPPAPEAAPLQSSRWKFWQWGAAERQAARTISLDGGADPITALLSDPAVTVVKQKNLGNGINSSAHVWLSNGLEGVWKSSSGEAQRTIRRNIEAGRQGPREAAAYIVDRYLGHLGGVQPCVHRKLEGQAGTLALWVKGAGVAAHHPLDALAITLGPKRQGYRNMAILDNVLGNLDRHKGNWMVGSTEDIVPIDHGLCFPTSNGHQGGYNYDFSRTVKLSEEERGALQNLLSHRTEATAELSKLLPGSAINAMFERVTTMLEKGRTYSGWRD